MSPRADSRFASAPAAQITQTFERYSLRPSAARSGSTEIHSVYWLMKQLLWTTVATAQRSLARTALGESAICYGPSVPISNVFLCLGFIFVVALKCYSVVLDSILDKYDLVKSTITVR